MLAGSPDVVFSISVEQSRHASASAALSSRNTSRVLWECAIMGIFPSATFEVPRLGDRVIARAIATYHWVLDFEYLPRV